MNREQFLRCADRFCRHYARINYGQRWGYIDRMRIRGRKKDLIPGHFKCLIDLNHLRRLTLHSGNAIELFLPLLSREGNEKRNVTIFLVRLDQALRGLEALRFAEELGEVVRDSRKRDRIAKRVGKIIEEMEGAGFDTREIEHYRESLENHHLTRCRIYENFLHGLANSFNGRKLTPSFTRIVNQLIDEAFEGLPPGETRELCRFSEKKDLTKFRPYTYSYPDILHQAIFWHSPSPKD